MPIAILIPSLVFLMAGMVIAVANNSMGYYLAMVGSGTLATLIGYLGLNMNKHKSPEAIYFKQEALDATVNDFENEIAYYMAIGDDESARGLIIAAKYWNVPITNDNIYIYYMWELQRPEVREYLKELSLQFH